MAFLDRAPELQILRSYSDRFFSLYMEVKRHPAVKNALSQNGDVLSTARIMIGFSDPHAFFYQAQCLANLIALKTTLQNTLTLTSDRRLKVGTSNQFADMADILDEAIAFVRTGDRHFKSRSEPLVGVAELGQAPFLIPDQKPAPIRIAPDQDGLRLEATPPANGDLDPSSVARLRRAAADQLRNAVRLCASSNTDERFVHTLRVLGRSAGRSDKLFSVEDLGIRCRVVQGELSSHQDAMPDVAVTQVLTALRTLRIVLNEHSEWREYERIEGLSDVERPDEIIALADDVAETLRNHPEVDPDIIERIASMTQSVRDGLLRSESVAVPLLTTLSNIMAQVARIVLENPTAIAFIKEAAWSGSTNIAGSSFIGLCLYIVQAYADRMLPIGALQFVHTVKREVERRETPSARGGAPKG